MRLDTADHLLCYMNEAPFGPMFSSEVEAFLSDSGNGGQLLRQRTPPRENNLCPARFKDSPFDPRDPVPLTLSTRTLERYRAKGGEPSFFILRSSSSPVASGTFVPTCWNGRWRGTRKGFLNGTEEAAGIDRPVASYSVQCIAACYQRWRYR